MMKMNTLENVCAYSTKIMTARIKRKNGFKINLS